eukprot:764205-Hanusia_phi.AAC.1
MNKRPRFVLLTSPTFSAEGCDQSRSLFSVKTHQQPQKHSELSNHVVPRQEEPIMGHELDITFALSPYVMQISSPALRFFPAYRTIAPPSDIPTCLDVS